MTAQSTLDIGFASIDITPEHPTPMAGFGIRKECFTGVHDPLYGHVLRVASGPDQAVAVVVAEIIGLPMAQVRKLRTRLAPLLAVDPDKIMIAATHTHGGPKVDEAYGDFLCERLQEAARRAFAASEPSWLRCGRAVHRERLGFNRRKLDRGAVPIDPEVPLLAFGPEGGPCRTVFFQYACHPACLGASNLQITADWPGFARRHLHALHPDHPQAVFMLGTAGNINTGYSAGLSALRAPIPTRNFAEAERLGLSLAQTIVRACDTLPLSRSLTVAAASRLVPVEPYQEGPAADVEAWIAELRTLQDAWRAKKGIPEALTDALKVELEYAGFALERAGKDPTAKLESLHAQVLRIGDALIGGFPGEFFAESGMAFKQHFIPHAATVFAGGPANGYEGYIPPLEAFAEGGYEANCSNYAPATAGAFVDHLIEAGRELV